MLLVTVSLIWFGVFSIGFGTCRLVLLRVVSVVIFSGDIANIIPRQEPQPNAINEIKRATIILASVSGRIVNSPDYIIGNPLNNLRLYGGYDWDFLGSGSIQYCE